MQVRIITMKMNVVSGRRVIKIDSQMISVRKGVEPHFPSKK
jgi:hypothetical protein